MYQFTYWDNLLNILSIYHVNKIFFLLSFLYLPMIYLGQKYMKNRKTVVVNNYLFTWNIFMSICSFIGTVISMPLLVSRLYDKGLQGYLCDIESYPNYSTPKYYKIQLVIFIYSTTKVFEWIDTIFLILKKRKIIFLHWFHHLFTMLYCWHSIYYSVYTDGTGWLFSTMNLFVHSVMYLYYGLKSKIYIPKYVSIFVTLLQTSQMFIGMYALILSTNCWRTLEYNLFGTLFGFFIYSIYFILFIKIVLNYFR